MEAERILFVLAAMLMLVGIGLALGALAYRTGKHPPIPTWNPRRWKPIWRMREWFTPGGFRMHLIGWGLFFVGDALMIVFYLTR